LMASLDESLLVRKENNAILQEKKSPILFWNVDFDLQQTQLKSSNNLFKKCYCIHVLEREAHIIVYVTTKFVMHVATKWQTQKNINGKIKIDCNRMMYISSSG
jgi:hypothetical protein